MEAKNEYSEILYCATSLLIVMLSAREINFIRLLLNFSYFLSNEIYFGRIFTVGNRNRSLKILFLDNVNILECENNIPLKSCSDIVKEKKNESDLVTK